MYLKTFFVSSCMYFYISSAIAETISFHPPAFDFETILEPQSLFMLDSKALYETDQRKFISDNELKWVYGDALQQFELKSNWIKQETEHPEWTTYFLYHHLIAPQTDVQIGLRHRRYEVFSELTQNIQREKRTDLIVGTQTLLPYEINSELYFYVGNHDYFNLVPKIDKDFILTEKIILNSELAAEILLRDQTQFAGKTGLHAYAANFELRYENDSLLTPYFTFGYFYNKGNQLTTSQDESELVTGWNYGLGVKIQF